jgi:hypothetical protein
LQHSLRESLVLRAAIFAVLMQENEQQSAFPSHGVTKSESKFQLQIAPDERSAA